MTSLTVQVQHGTEVERIIAAKQSTEIRQCEQPTLYKAVADAVMESFKITGQDLILDKVKSEIDLICDMILKDYPYLAINEIKVAANLGAFGKFGEFYGINPRTFKQWLEGYRLSHEVRKSTRILEEREYAKQKIKTQIDIPNKHEYYNYLCSEGSRRSLHGDESDFKIAYSLQIEFDNHRVGDIVIDPQNIYYNLLDENGIISFTTQEKHEAVALAESGAIRLKSNGKLDEALHSFYSANVKKSHYLAKCYLLTQYFDDCKRNKKNPL